ncbi:hypothetical protein [Arthrobacter sp. ISL-5]|nr:hypothetical protein [Arthrobacter sp. ISL-5]
MQQDNTLGDVGEEFLTEVSTQILERLGFKARGEKNPMGGRRD